MAMGHPFQVLDLGGGLGISYQGEEIPAVEDYARALIGPVRKLGLKLIIEPGRSLVGKTGVLLTKVIGLKSTPAKKFVVVDGAMNDLIRPCLYEAYHEIESVVQAPVAPNLVDIVGPICETADFFGHDRKLPNVRKGDVLYVKDCGAYGFSMASNYNSRPRPAEVLVDGASFTVARRRETLNEIWAMETTTA